MFHPVDPDKENDQRRASYAPPPATVRKRLFPTPITTRATRARPSISSAASAYENSNDILRTPLPKLPPSATTLSIAASSVRRSSHAGPATASLKGTPCFKRKYVETNPDVWLQRQVDDLTAWLNHELGDLSSSASYFPTQNFASSDVFIAQYEAVLRFYRGPTFNAEVLRFGNHIKKANLSFSTAVSIATEQPKFEQLVSLLTFSYNSTWLLLGLSLILHTNFALQIDEVLQQAQNTPNKRIDVAVLQQKLVDYILRNHFTTENPVASKFTITSPSTVFTPSSNMDSVKQNGLVLYRTLLLIMLLDHAAQDTDVVNNLPFPLFKPDSSVHKSQEVVDRLSQICLQNPDSLNRFLGDRGYRLEYDCPPWDRISNFAVRDLGTDLRDGIRLCKLASLLTGDPRPLQQVKYNYGSRLSDATRHKKHSFNIMIALDTISKYAADRLRAKVQWKATAREIIDGNIPETVALLWQIAELWIEIKLLDNSLLDESLSAAQDEFRARTADAVWCSSPETFRELSPTIKSPSRLVIYQRPDKDCIRKLLQWCATVCGIHRIKVVDFTESFRDCAVLCILLDQLHPGMIEVKDIIRVAPAEIRDEQDSVKELGIVRSNIKLFEGACQRLGALPNISISAMAALAPPFISRLKEESFGRLMILMTAYLFKRVELGRGAKERLEYVQQHAEREVDYGFSCSPHGCDDLLKPLGTKTWDLPGSTDLGRLDTSGSSDNSSGKAFSPEKQEDTPSVLVGEVDMSVPLAHNAHGSESLPRPFKPSTFALPNDDNSKISTPTVERKRKEEAAEVILSNYEAYKACRNVLNKKDNAVLLQTLIRRFLAHQDYEELLYSQKELVNNLHSEFWNRKSLVGTNESSISNSEYYSISEKKKEASEGFGLCLKSLDDVEKVMLLFPDHLKTIDHYVQSMQEHEERSRNAPTQQILGIGVDFAPHNDASSDKTNPTKRGELQMVNGIGSMVTTHISLPDPSTPVDQSQNVSGHCSPSPGGESQVFRTPWTGIRPRKIASSRYYGATPSDRYSWHTASPDIVKTNIEHHAASHDASSKRSPSQDYVDSYGTDSGERTELTAEDGEGRSQVATEGESIQGQDELNFSSQSMAAGSKALFSAALSTIGTIGRATHHYLRSRNEYMLEVAAQSVHGAEAALPKTPSLPHPYHAQVSRISQSIGQSASSTRSSTPSNDAAGTVQSTDESGDETSLLEGRSLEAIHDSFETSNSLQVCEDVEQELSSSTSSENSHDSDNTPEVPRDTKITLSPAAACESCIRDAPNLIANITDNEDVLRSANTNADGEQAAPEEQTSISEVENSQVDVTGDNEGSRAGLTFVSCVSDEFKAQSSLEDDSDGLEPPIHGSDHQNQQEAVAELFPKLPDKSTTDDGGEATPNKYGNLFDLDSSTNHAEESQITETALRSAENAYMSLMHELQSSHEYDLEGRRGLDLRFSELEKADLVALKRLELETDKLETSHRAIETRYITLETPHSNSVEFRRTSVIVDEDNLICSEISFPVCDAEQEYAKLEHVSCLMKEEDEVLRSDLEDIESTLQKEHQESEVQLKALMGTVLSSACFLAEWKFARHMKERLKRKQEEQAERDEEVRDLDQEFKKRMWTLNLERTRIGEEERRLDSEIMALEVSYQKESNTVFELLEAEIDTRLLTLQNAEDKERMELLLRIESREECGQRIIDVEDLINSYQQLKGEEDHQEDQAEEEIYQSIPGKNDLPEEYVINEEEVEFCADMYAAKSTTSAQDVTVTCKRSYAAQGDAASGNVQTRRSLDNVGEENQDPSEFPSNCGSSSVQYQARRFSPQRVASPVLASVNVHVDTPPPVKETTGNSGLSVNSGLTSLQALQRKDYFEQTKFSPRSNDQKVRLNGAPEDASNLENLSVELSSFNITSSRKSVDDVMSNPSSASKLHALIRRISTATASPSRCMSDSLEHRTSESHSMVCQNIIRTILVVLRHLHRTSTHIRLIDRGITIIRDFCEVQDRVADVISVEDCIDVIVTCAQFYRDREGILEAAVSVLYYLSQDIDGETLMRKNENALKRLERINNLLNSAAKQERKHRIRVQHARLIVNQVRLREKGVSRHVLLSEDLAAAQKESAPLELRIRPSHRLLCSLLSELKSKGVV